MPRSFYRTDAELREAVTRLNNLFCEYSQFTEVQARKEHTDEFGFPIQRGETYYKREYGGWAGNVIKLTVESMEKVCAAIFWGNTWADHYLKVPELKCAAEYLPMIPPNSSGSSV